MFIQLKKKKLKYKILPTWGSELCRVYAVIPFAIQARNTPERHLGASSLEWGKGSNCQLKILCLRQSFWNREKTVVGLPQPSLNKRFYARDSVAPYRRSDWPVTATAPLSQSIGSGMDTQLKDSRLTYEVARHKKMSWANWILFLSGPITMLAPGTKKHRENKAVNSGGHKGELGHGGHVWIEIMMEQRMERTGMEIRR